MQFNKLLNFYKDCFEADTRTLSLTNVFSQKFENRHFISGQDELLNKHLPSVPIDAEVARAIVDNISMYSQEKSLYLTAFLATGKTKNSNNRNTNLCAPILFYPATIHENDGFYFLSVHHELAFVNAPFLESYRLDSSIEVAEILDEFIGQPMSFEKCGRLKRTLETQFKEMNVDQLLLYPELCAEKTVSKYIKAPTEDGLQVFPASVLGIMKHSVSTIGIINELKKLIKSEAYSTPLRCFFDHDYREQGELLQHNTFVPAILSTAQESIIQSANQNVETVVIGPPGTGKSFSIAALAIDQMNRGNSVLVVSKSDQAVDVIEQKITEDLGITKVTVRAGRKAHLSSLKERLKDILSGVPIDYRSAGKRAATLKTKIYADKAKLKEWQLKLEEQIEDDLKWGQYLFENENGGIISSIKKKLIEWSNSKQKSYCELIENYYQTKEEYLNDLKEYVELCFQEQLWKTLKHHRDDLRTFLMALRARTLAKQELLFEEVDFGTILKAFPIWICRLGDLYEVLPFREELFDVVIIDEASQCDITSCLPALQRAKRVVVVGDPKQLRHYSFLSRRFTEHLKGKYQLHGQWADQYFEYRDNSILDIYFTKVSGQDQITFLDEHFRGNDRLIGFSNENFYQERLKVMKSLPSHKNDDGLKLVRVNGQRSKEGTNEIEACELLETVRHILENENDLTTDSATSIGILSPFRSHAEYLEVLTFESLPHDLISKHKIKIGTPYSFQGDERDCMLISICLDDDAHSTAYHYINTPEVFNVAITRAKVMQYVYSSSRGGAIETLLAEYLRRIDEYSEYAQKSGVPEDRFQQEVIEFVHDHSTDVYRDYLVAGILVDILIHTGAGYVGIDLIGYPGKFYEALHIKEYEILGRSGVKMIPLPYPNWYYEKEKTQEELIRTLSSL